MIINDSYHALNQYIHSHSSHQDDDMNQSRITALLTFDSCLWLGTGDGNLIMYDIVDPAEVGGRSHLTPNPQQGGGMWGSPQVGPDYLEPDKLMEKVRMCIGCL